MTISTWTGAAACRNVPHWVAAGNSRLVTKNMIRLITQQRPQGEAASLPWQRHQPDHRDRDAEQDEHVEQVVRQPGDAQLDQGRRPDREVAGQGGRVVPGEDVEAGQVQRVRDGLARQRAAEDEQVPIRPRREDRRGDDGDDPDQAQPLRPRPIRPRTTPSPPRSGRARRSRCGSAPQARGGRRARSAAGRSTRAPRGSRTMRVMSRQRPSTIAANGIVESGRAELSSSGR